MGHDCRRHTKYLYCLVSLIILFTATSCGVRVTLDSTGGTEKELEVSVDGEDSIPFGEENDSSIAVAEFHYLEIPEQAWQIAMNDEWIYYAEMVEDETSKNEQYLWSIFRNKLSDTIQPETYLVSEKNTLCSWMNTMFLDKEGNCYVFWSENEEVGPGEGRGDLTGYYLEKYDENGMLIWHVDYALEEFNGAGESLNQGLVTEDGRIFLYQTGSGGSIYALAPDGNLEERIMPELEVLEGVAKGKDSGVYAWCIAGGTPKLVEVMGDRKEYDFPIEPLQVYSGREDGVYLCDREGLWSYRPEEGKASKLWNWDDEYIQLDVSSIRQMVRERDSVCMFCREQFTNTNGEFKLQRRKDVLTLVKVRFENSSDYPEREKVILEQSEYYHELTDHTEYMVQRFNRENRRYKVEIISHEGDYTAELKMQLLQGKGPDLIGLRDMDVSDLALKGAFEDLSEYYASSIVSNGGEILSAVRKAGTVAGREVLVIPAFYIESLWAYRRADTEKAAEHWTPQCFLELAKENRMFRVQSPEDAFWYCMGIIPGEYFIDYETKVSNFDSEEFRNILEECKQWETYRYEDCAVGSEPVFSLEGCEWILQKGLLYEIKDFANSEEFLIGYPGWDGAAHELRAEEVFAINSASENKAGAWAFLEFLLSEEMQKSIDWAFPVREDCFEDCLREPLTDRVSLEKRQPTEDEKNSARKCVEAAVYNHRLGNKDYLRNIMAEEVRMYFAGDADLETTVQKIQSRVQLYLDEM